MMGGITYRMVDPDRVRHLLAEGEFPPVVFGPDRERAARQVAALVTSLAPSRDEELVAALTDSPILERRIRAHRTGRQFLREAYDEYDLTTEPRGHGR